MSLNSHEPFAMPDVPKAEAESEQTRPGRPIRLRFTDGDRKPRAYQEAAIHAWQENGFRGILAMATGTGKTLTSLLAAERLLAVQLDIKAVVIAAPFQHLADQWAEEFADTDLVPVKAYKSTAKWQDELVKARIIYRHLRKPIVILTTYTTLGSAAFFEAIEPLAGDTLLIADECHYLGAEGSRNFLRLPIPYRLGLSATPERHFDDEGTARLLNYFDRVVYEFGMAVAIEQGFLTPYKYLPEFVELTAEESDEYTELTLRISKAAARAQNKRKDSDEQEVLKQLLIKRARIINNAQNKLDWLRKKFTAKPADELPFTLVYTGDELFKEVLNLLGNEMGVPVHSFTGKESANKRKELLEQFTKGEIKVLVAMRCLDEGVDVPATRTAYFLASSTNARQYVQRRGRVLRRSEGKEFAIVHDTVVIPPKSALDTDATGERTAFVSQFDRIQEFASLALNATAVAQDFLEIRLRNNLPFVPTEGERTDN